MGDPKPGQSHFRGRTNSGGHLQYSVASDGQARLHAATAGVIVDGVDLGAHAELGAVQRRSIDESFVWRGNKTTAVNRCRVAGISIRTPGAAAGAVSWEFEARVFDDGAAFRYRVPGAGSRRVAGESTTWQLPGGATVWFQTSTTSYENEYRAARADALPVEEKDRKGVMRRVHLGPPATVAYADGTFGLISEAALRRYSGLSLRPEGTARLTAAFRDDAQGWSHDGEILSPWRVLVFARDLHGLVNSDVIPALCDPPDPTVFLDGMNTPWIKPGRSICTWMVFGNDGGAWDRQKWFVDQCARIGCEYLLVDGGWQSERWGWLKDGADPWSRAAELVRYGAERGVGILLWHAYAENRADGPGLTRPEARELFFQRCRDAGVQGVKIDFFDSESKAMVEARKDILRRAAKYRLAQRGSREGRLFSRPRPVDRTYFGGWKAAAPANADVLGRNCGASAGLGGEMDSSSALDEIDLGAQSGQFAAFVRTDPILRHGDAAGRRKVARDRTRCVTGFSA